MPSLGKDEVQTEGIWFGPRERPLAGWLTRPRPLPSVSAVVIAPPTGYAYWCAHRPLRRLAERLAANGHDVLRFDYDATGDSAGDQWDDDRVAAWRESLAAAVTHMRERGAERVSIIGARLGATIALLDAEALGAHRVVAWLPFAQGRRYGKEIRLLGDPVPGDHEPEDGGRTLVVAGTVFSADTIRDLGGLDLDDLGHPPSAPILLVDEPGGSCSDVATQLRAVGAEVDLLSADDAEETLETPPEYGSDHDALTGRIAEWLAREVRSEPMDRARAHRVPPSRVEASLPWRDGVLTERFVRLGEEDHAAVITEPARTDPGAALFVLLNPGSETHVGPGRAWVEYARDLALHGRCVARVDFVGWGESPDGDHGAGRPYDAACVADALRIVRALRALGHERVVVGGLCASAWIALDLARTGEPDGVVAINPQLYWQPGDPVEINWDLIRARRREEVRRIELGERLHAWDALDLIGRRDRVGRWLDDLGTASPPVELLFTDADDGLVFLRSRQGRRLRTLVRGGRLGVAEVPEIDHPMHHSWLRGHMAQALAGALERIDAAAKQSSRNADRGPAVRAA